jgi:hypothetical protein
MTRFFFDVNADGAVEHDYNGRFLPDLSQAQQMAELIAMDLSCTRREASTFMEVQIRDAVGSLFCSVPVRMLDALAT